MQPEPIATALAAAGPPAEAAPPHVWALTPGGSKLLKPVRFTVARFRFAFTCACGGAVALDQHHVAQMCRCGLIYTMTGSTAGAVEYLRTARPAPRPAAR